jgi:hypothetical protein
MFAFPEALTGAMFSSEYSERGVLLPYIPAASLCSAIICFGLEASGRIKSQPAIHRALEYSNLEPPGVPADGDRNLCRGVFPCLDIPA